MSCSASFLPLSFVMNNTCNIPFPLFGVRHCGISSCVLSPFSFPFIPPSQVRHRLFLCSYCTPVIGHYYPPLSSLFVLAASCYSYLAVFKPVLLLLCFCFLDLCLAYASSVRCMYVLNYHSIPFS